MVVSDLVDLFLRRVHAILASTVPRPQGASRGGPGSWMLLRTQTYLSTRWVDRPSQTLPQPGASREAGEAGWVSSRQIEGTRRSAGWTGQGAHQRRCKHRDAALASQWPAGGRTPPRRTKKAFWDAAARTDSVGTACMAMMMMMMMMAGAGDSLQTCVLLQRGHKDRKAPGPERASGTAGKDQGPMGRRGWPRGSEYEQGLERLASVARLDKGGLSMGPGDII